jgi:hypothetical protein
MKTCQTCDAWLRRSDSYAEGECHRRAPLPLVLIDPSPTEPIFVYCRWPLTRENEGCIEWVPQPIAQTPAPVKRADSLCKNCCTWACDSAAAEHLFRTGHHPSCPLLNPATAKKESIPCPPTTP